jgi:hypothetical protein
LVLDLVFIAVIIAFFTIAVFFVRACELLTRAEEEQ